MDLVEMRTTTPSVAEAQTIADRLVEQRLAACVQVTGHVASTYRWQGTVERAEEYSCLIKTRRDLTDEVEAVIRALHSYDNPEIIVVPIEGGSTDYLAWVEAETQPPSDTRPG